MNVSGQDTRQRIGWGIVIKGHDFDLEDWRNHLSRSTLERDVWIELVAGQDGSQMHVLRSAELNAAKDSSDAWKIGKEIHALVDGLMRVKHETHRTEPDAVVELFDSGSPSRHIFMEIKEGITIRSRVSAVLTVIDSEGNERPTPPLPKRTDAQKALRLCLRKEDMAEALEHFSKAGQNNWTELFKAYEAVGLCVGGNLVKLGWTNNDGAERFIKTCHHYRHHKHPLPDRPMGWGEAKHFVRALLNKALDHPWK